MSAAVEERLVDFALHELYREGEVDLTDRIVEAWERGERGTSLSELDAPRETPRILPPRATGAKPQRWLAAAAAGLLVASGAAWWMFAREREPERHILVAHADRAVPVLRAGARLDSADIQSGDVFSLAPAQPLAFADAKLSSREGAVLAMRDDGLALLRGAVDLDCAARTGFEAGPARGATAGAARVSLELALRDDPKLAAAPFDAALAEQLELAREGPSSLRIYVASGELSVKHAGGTERLPAGLKRELWRAVPSTEPELEESANKNVRMWLSELGSQMPEPETWSQMNVYFATHPQRWKLLRAVIEEQVEREVINKLGFHEIVRFGLDHPTGEGLPFVRDMWLAYPDGFRDFEIAVLAERGLFEFEREAEAMVADDRPDRRATMCAALLARRGSAEALEQLRRSFGELKPARADDDLARMAYAGFALAQRGDAQAWRRTIEFARRALEAELRVGGVYVAAQCVGVLLQLDRMLVEGGDMPMSRYLALPRSGWPDRDAQGVRAALDELARPK